MGNAMNLHINPETLFLTVGQVAKRYGVSVETIWRWSRDEELPKPVKLAGNTTRWRLSDLEAHEAGLKAHFMMELPPFKFAA